MGTLLYIALIFGVLLPSAIGQDWDLDKMRRCPCVSKTTNEITSTVARGCITDAQGRRLTLRLSPADSDGCVANVMDKVSPGEIDVFLTYNGKLEDGAEKPQGMDTNTMGHHNNPDGEMDFTFQLNVNDGKLSDSTEPRKKSNNGIKIRKRDLMPFSFVNFNIIIRTDLEAGCDLRDQTKFLLMKGLKRYWDKMTDCLLDVTE
ncbi:uncharacterized protein [Pyxicephalus adspersus]